MDMNSGKSMDDILDSIRKIVSEEETGETAPKRPVSVSQALKMEESEAETLFLTKDMRVDKDATLNLSRSERVSDEEMDAIASLRLDLGAKDKSDEAEREAIASLRLNRMPAAHPEHRDDVAAFGAALADDDFEEDAEDDPEVDPDADLGDEHFDDHAELADLSALDDAADEKDDAPDEPTDGDADAPRDAYGFVAPPPENPYARRSDQDSGPRDTGAFSLRLNRTAQDDRSEDARDAASDAPEEAIVLGNETAGASEASDADVGAATVTAQDADADGDDDAMDMPASRGQIARMVRSAVRDELSGALGDKITRNIRGMVRREIERVMETKQIK